MQPTNEPRYDLCRGNKGADQFRGYCEADLVFVFAYAKCWFSHDAAHMFLWRNIKNYPKISPNTQPILRNLGLGHNVKFWEIERKCDSELIFITTSNISKQQ